MTVVLLLCVPITIGVGSWLVHRGKQVRAWNREIETAFRSGNDGQTPLYRGL